MEKLQLTFDNKFVTKHKIGKGNSSVFIGSIKNGEKQVAIKLQKADDRNSVEYEAKIYKLLKDIEGIPKLYWYGNQHQYNALVIDVLGPSLADLLKYCNGKFTLKTVLMIADQIIDRLQAIHSKGLVYRDVKPTNFLVGMGPKTDKIYVIDFELSEKFVDLDWNHLVLGAATPRGYSDQSFVSVHGHLNTRQSRRDDLQSLGYMMIYFLKGQLPWGSISDGNKQIQNQLIKQAKVSCPIQILCKGLPSQLATYFNYVKTLQYQQQPDYRWMKRQFKDLFDQSDYCHNLVFDWAEKYHVSENKI